MISHTAINDIAAIERGGATVPHETVIRLNALALRAQNCAECADWTAAPRVAFAGGVALYEPSVQSEDWFATCACRWFPSSVGIVSGVALRILAMRRRLPPLAYARAWSLSVAHVTGAFAGVRNATEARERVVAWASSLDCTDAALTEACGYALFGDDDAGNETDPRRAPEGHSPITKLVNEIVAAGLGLSMADVLALPLSRALDIMVRWTRYRVSMAGADKEGITKQLQASAWAEYWVALDKAKRECSRVNDQPHDD